jgi:hypothetical protein
VTAATDLEFRRGEIVTIVLTNVAVVRPPVVEVDGVTYLDVRPREPIPGQSDNAVIRVPVARADITRIAPPEFADLYPGDIYEDSSARLWVWQATPGHAGRTGYQFTPADHTKVHAPAGVHPESLLQTYGPVNRVFAAPRPAGYDPEVPF